MYRITLCERTYIKVLPERGDQELPNLRCTLRTCVKKTQFVFELERPKALRVVCARGIYSMYVTQLQRHTSHTANTCSCANWSCHIAYYPCNEKLRAGAARVCFIYCTWTEDATNFLEGSRNPACVVEKPLAISPNVTLALGSCRWKLLNA